MPPVSGPVVVPLRSVEQLTQLYRDVLSPSFPPAELVSLDAFLADHAAGHLESLGVVEVPDGAAPPAGRVVAGVVGSWSAEARVLLVQYLAIAPGRRGGGIGAALLGAAVAAWLKDLRPVMVLGEVEHPRFHAASEAHGDPEARLRFYARHGGRVLAVPYFQPGNEPGAERVPALLLMTLATEDPGATSVPAAPLRTFLREYFEASEGTLADDAPTRALLDATSGDRVELLGVDELDRVPVGLLDGSSLRAPVG
ncbi:N-acetyltransferase [Oerskovia sp. KBS0722]|uniref:N-acetyltransferase n=1 Tax=Oerskovia sp. KBS0722 TaxID=1179673 RepID=UPI00110EBBCF|nr:N-acetyltransferase [Oerskovia sp. KBS0722]QDW62859.1 N-acetyltransferase [Oerskovia sp. KBS0722]